MKRLALVALLALGLSGCEQSHASPPPSSFLPTPTEIEALDGLEQKIKAFDAEVSSLVSDVNTRNAIYGGVLQIQARSQALAQEAGKARGGVALVASFTPSGRAWVPAR